MQTFFWLNDKDTNLPSYSSTSLTVHMNDSGFLLLAIFIFFLLCSVSQSTVCLFKRLNILCAQTQACTPPLLVLLWDVTWWGDGSMPIRCPDENGRAAFSDFSTLKALFKKVCFQEPYGRSAKTMQYMCVFAKERCCLGGASGSLLMDQCPPRTIYHFQTPAALKYWPIVTAHWKSWQHVCGLQCDQSAAAQCQTLNWEWTSSVHSYAPDQRTSVMEHPSGLQSGSWTGPEPPELRHPAGSYKRLFNFSVSVWFWSLVDRVSPLQTPEILLDILSVLLTELPNFDLSKIPPLL